MRSLLWLELGLSLALGAVAQNCNSTVQCPERAPCCSEYGFCGRGGTYCLGGCDPFGRWAVVGHVEQDGLSIASFELESCMPNPICRDWSTDFRQNLTRIEMNGTEYDGDVKEYDWISECRLWLGSNTHSIRFSQSRPFRTA